MLASVRTGDEEYAGDISSAEAWNRLASDPVAQLIDVRTQPEWSFVGVPDLGKLGKRPLFVSWQIYPEMSINPRFVEELRAQGAEPGKPLYFICRSGARSRAAAKAMTAAGFSPCFNIAGGFEGDLDAEKHRGRLGGWKAAGLAWVQS
ncbi:MAG TPA: rhodanese-like domain-containing protein [Ferrovibrio sp.]|jgi:rhodanese-related sulfurtransferase|uniref:rhodanese-like domain-containing protein n=1 Tax=Ferrovibrio sp. TaxID=1917215 RepID=UPI002B4B017F|nr:rhodanese-like domain-containing protein [Ferrovibrio sp.]HLT78867.1 rhodanese-like domain-containing protein [Ferrovibrio sp.]